MPPHRVLTGIALAAAFAAGAAASFVAYREQWWPFHAGSDLREAMKNRERRWALAGRAEAPPEEAEPDSEDEALSALGYVGHAAEAPATTGVVRHVAGRASPGFEFVVADHAPEASLIDLDGRLRHRWSTSLADAWPGTKVGTSLGSTKGRSFRRARPLADGSVVALFERVGIVRLDRDSRVVWVRESRVHHDVDVLPDGRLAVLSAEVTTGDARIPVRAGKTLLADQIDVLDPATGALLERHSVLEAVLRSPWAPLLAESRDHRDLTHTNTVSWLDGSLADRIPAFARGNYLLCIRNLDTVAVLDPGAGRIVWAMTGMWRLPHESRVVPPGRILLFDNQGFGRFSRVLEVDPVTQEVAWSFDGNEGNGFFSAFCGTTQRLPNGNTLIVETNGARAFEVTPEHDLVWQYVCPHRAPDDPRFSAKLFDVVRLPEGFGEGWLRALDDR